MIIIGTMGRRGVKMAGIGDILGLLARTAIQEKTKNTVVGASLGNAVAKTANQFLTKCGIQDENGKLLVSLPFLKTVEQKTRKIMTYHPEWTKVFFNFGSTLEDGVFYDIDGNPIYRIQKASGKMSYASVLNKDNNFGSVERKNKILKNPLVDVDKFILVLQGRELGNIEIYDKSVKTYIKPDFGAWQILSKGLHNYMVCDDSEKEVAFIYYPGENNYIFDISENFEFEVLLLCFLAIQMRNEQHRKKMERQRKVDQIKRPVKTLFRV